MVYNKNFIFAKEFAVGKITIGDRFGRLHVESFSHKDIHGQLTWIVVCDCGNKKAVTGSNLRGKTKSCGCLHKESSKLRLLSHGMSKTKTYKIWKGIVSRCTLESATGYYNYGGRGITISEEWKSFESFHKDMGDCPDGCSIERIDTNGNYCAANCKWAPDAEQGINKRNNRIISISHKDVCLSVAARENGVNFDFLRARINRGWGGENAVALPKNTKINCRKIVANGIEKSVAEWAKAIQMTPRSLHLRLQSGWSEYDAVTIKKGHKRLL